MGTWFQILATIIFLLRSGLATFPHLRHGSKLKNVEIGSEQSINYQRNVLLERIYEIYFDKCQMVLVSNNEEVFTSISVSRRSNTYNPVINFKIKEFLEQSPQNFANNLISKCVAFVFAIPYQDINACMEKTFQKRWFHGISKYIFILSEDEVNFEQLDSLTVNDFGDSIVLASPTPKLPSQKDEVYRNITKQKIFDIYALRSSNITRRKLFVLSGNWPTSSVRWETKKLFFKDLKDISDRTFQIVTMDYPPFSFYKPNAKYEGRIVDTKLGETVNLGKCVDLLILDSFAKKFRFKYSLHEPVDKVWGYQLPNGSYTGVVGAVERMEADFSLNIASDFDRRHVIDFSIGYYTDPLTIITSKPKIISQSLAVLKPFQWKVWICFFVSIIFACIAFLFFTHISSNEKERSGKQDISYIKQILAVTAATVNQGSHWPKQNAPRVLIVFWFFTCLVIVASYVGMLIASYSIPTLTPTLNELHELIISDFTWGLEDNFGAAYSLFKDSTIDLYKQIFEKSVFCPSTDECLKKGAEQEFAFIHWKLNAQDNIAMKFTSSTGGNPFHVSEKEFFPSFILWGVKIGAPYLELINQHIQNLIEYGFIELWVKQIIEDPRRRTSAFLTDMDQIGTLQTASLGIDKLQGIFYILLMGWVISLFTLFFEVTFSKIKHRQK